MIKNRIRDYLYRIINFLGYVDYHSNDVYYHDMLVKPCYFDQAPVILGRHLNVETKSEIESAFG
jgi:hypothetical protein